jgi:hypothetical protein
MMTDASGHESLVIAHETRLRALLDGDLDTLRTVVGEDLVFVSSHGKTNTRPEVFAAVEAGTLQILRMDASDVSTRLYGDIGILIYKADAKMIDGDTTIEGMTRSTTVYSYRDSGWQLVFQHQSRIE